ncbi:hypothetical protein AAMO2058_001621400 [Amorphochlora amoebiformis]
MLGISQIQDNANHNGKIKAAYGSQKTGYGMDFRVPASLTQDFANMLLQSSPERSTSAPPLDLRPEVLSRASTAAPQFKSKNQPFHKRDSSFESKRLSSLSYSPSTGLGSEIYSSGSPSPITGLKAPVAKRIAKLEMGREGETEQTGQTGQTGQIKPYTNFGRSRSVQSLPDERSASFRGTTNSSASSNRTNSSTSANRRMPPLLAEMGRMHGANLPGNNRLESHDGGDQLDSKGYRGSRTERSSSFASEKSTGSFNRYHQAYGHFVSEGDAKIRGNPYSPHQNGGARFLQISASSDSLSGRFQRSKSAAMMPPRYGETRAGNPSHVSMPLAVQQSLLQQLLEQQALNAAHVGGGSSIRSHLSLQQHGFQTPNHGRSSGSRGRKNNSGSFKSHQNGTRRGGKRNDRGKGRRGQGGRGGGGGGGGHSLEINTIGIASRMHVRWLEAFGTPKTAHVTLEDVAKQKMTVDLAMDQYGSRFIQQRLERAPASHKEVTFQAILPHTLRLCADVFGNYVIQKLFEHGTGEHKRALSAQLRGHVLPLSMQMYGCRVVQKAIDVLNLDQKSALIQELHGHVMKCVRDQNGNHVIQKCIEKVPPSHIQFVVDAFGHQNMKLAMHPYGCRVIQRLLEHCSGQQRESILNEILASTQLLARNQYGNYVVQHILLHADAGHRAAVMEAFKGSFMKLSKHKFASNVVEKCVTHATRDERKELIDEILGDPDLDSASLPLTAMARDQYANYVVQRLIEIVDPEQRQYLIKRIQPHLHYLSKVPYGKHILASIEKAQESGF